MGTQITDTNLVSAPLKRVRLGGLAFKVPQSPTLAYMFWMSAFVKKFAGGNLTDDDVLDCYEQTLEFLRQFNRDVDEQKLQRAATLTDLVMFYTHCYGADSTNDDDEGDALPPRARRGTSGASRNSRRSRS